jgi:nucleotide-binding universal stress UspA family protein
MGRTGGICEPESESVAIQEGGEVAATQQQQTRQQKLLEPKRGIARIDKPRGNVGRDRESAFGLEQHDAHGLHESEGSIVAAVEPRMAHVTADTAARLARELGAPLVFIYVRERPPAILGSPNYQRRLTEDLVRGRRTLDTALAAARRHGVMSYGEIVEGDPATRIVEFANARKAQLLVVGPRRRRFWPSVLRRVIRSSEQPVVVAVRLQTGWRGHGFPRRRGRLNKTQDHAPSSAFLSPGLANHGCRLRPN